VPQALLLGVGLDQCHLLGRAAGQPQVGQGLPVDREDRAGGAELGAHVADGGPVGERDGGHALAVELDELADHAVLAQQLGDGQDQVGGRRAGRQLAGQPEPDHPRDEHRHRLAEHGRLGLDPADAPAEHAQAVLHGGVRVGAHAGVGERGGDPVPGRLRHDDAGQVLDVDLVHDAGAGRDDLELAQRLLAPAQEREPLPVALELQGHVPVEGVGPAEHVSDHRVVDHQLGRDERVDLARVAAQRGHGLAHRGQVHDGRDAGQVLQDDPGRAERDLDVGVGGRVPLPQGADVRLRDVHAVLGPQQVLEQDLEAEREGVSSGHGVQPVDLVAGPAHVESGFAAEAVRGHGWLASWGSGGAPSHPATYASSRSRGVRCRTPPATAAGWGPAGRGAPPVANYLDVKLSARPSLMT
jgi:hypothetical protein